MSLLDAYLGEWMTEYKRIRKGREEVLKSTFSTDNQHLRAILLLAIDSGMRRNEILSLRWKDIDFCNGTLHDSSGVSRAKSVCSFLRFGLVGDFSLSYTEASEYLRIYQRLRLTTS